MTSEFQQLKINGPIKVSAHFAKRVKKRAKIKTAMKRDKFVKDFSTYGLTISQISRFGEFKNTFIPLMEKIKNRSIQLGNIGVEVFLYKKFFVLVGNNGTLVTLYPVPFIYRNLYYEIRQKMLLDENRKESSASNS